MKLYLVVNIVFGVLGVILRIYYIGKDEYPREVKNTAGLDLTALLVSLCCTLWAGLIYYGVIK